MVKKKRAEADLRMYTVWKSAMEGITEDIEKEKGDTRSLKAVRMRIYRKVRTVERGLALLDEEQRRILEVFYINRHKGHVWDLCEELYIETAEVYRRKDRALETFVTGAYLNVT